MVFDETSLHEAIIKTWGEHGAHNDAFTAMRHRLRSVEAENERLREALTTALARRAHRDDRGAVVSDQVTAPSLWDRIAAAWSDHETGTLHPEGYVPCSCGQRLTSPQALARHRASVMLEVLADADPTDLGLEQVGWFVRFPSGIEAIRLKTPFTNDSDMERQQPIYARPRPEETTDG